MINALNLLWIVPLAVGAGAFCMALLAVNSQHGERIQEYERR